MSSFLSLQSGTIASFAVVVSASPRCGHGPEPGVRVPVLSQVETMYGTVIGNRPHGTPGAHSVVIVPVTAVAWVVAVKVDRPMARAKYVPKLRDALARTPCAPVGNPDPTVPDHVSLEVGVLGRRDRHVVVGGRSVDRLADLEVPGVAGRGRAGPDGSGRRAAAHQVLGDDDGPGLGNRVGSILRGPLLGQRVATVDNEGDSGDQGDEPAGEDDQDLALAAVRPG